MGEGAHCAAPVQCVCEPKKTGAHAWPKPTSCKYLADIWKLGLGTHRTKIVCSAGAHIIQNTPNLEVGHKIREITTKLQAIALCNTEIGQNILKYRDREKITTGTKIGEVEITSNIAG